MGGRARRFEGRVKSTLLVGNRPILARQLQALRAARIDHIVLIGRWPFDEPPPVPVVADAVDAAGALAALYTALLTATHDTVVVLAGDMPFVNEALVTRLTAIDMVSDAVIPRDPAGTHPLCACYRRRVATKLKRRIDDREFSVRSATRALHVSEIGADELRTMDPAGMMLMNVNTPDDYARACGLAAAAAMPYA